MKWHRYKQESEKKKNYVLLAALAVACVAALSIGSVTLSRYVLKSEDQQVATPASFYFESDYLKEGGAAYTVYTGSVNIKIANHDGLNITRDTISYTIDGTGNAGTQTLNGGLENSAEYTLSGKPGETKKVTATSAYPYAKTLSATFLFQDPGESTVYKVTDQGYYLTLDLYTGAKTDAITVHYDADLAPDNTNQLMAGWISGTSGILSGLSPNTHYCLVFFERTAAEYLTTGEQILSGGTITLSK